MRANYAIRISTVKKLVVIVCLLCAKELSFANPSDTQRKHDGHCPHRACSDSPPCGASAKRKGTPMEQKELAKQMVLFV
ncbi:hypothetical protein V8C86DRAFT_2762234, partial [Haematococcus lacustris]